MSEAWLAQRERGSPVALRLITWLASRGGYRLGRALLPPICVYFIAFSGPARRASRDYWRRVTGAPARWRDVYRQYHTFATTLLDRIDLLGGRFERFDLHTDGGEAVMRALESRRGCLLLGSHVGSFEMMRAVGVLGRGIALNVVMHEANAKSIGAWMRELAPSLAARTIAPGQPDTMLRVRECLERGEAVAMLADRPIAGAPTVPAPFLGATARLPVGPFRLAAILRVPAFLFFGIHRGDRRYEIRFEPLAIAGQASSKGAAPALARHFAARLEAQVRDAPANWFNFYDFWGAR